MADLPFWTYDGDLDKAADSPIVVPGEWDSLILHGAAMPGLATVDVEQDLKVDSKRAPGRSGASPTFHGRDPAKFTIQIIVWTKSQLDDLQQRLLDIWPPDIEKKAPQSWDMEHPNLALLGIKGGIIRRITGLKPGPVSGARTMTLTCEEYRKGSAKKVTKTFKGSVPNVIAPKRLNAGPASLSPDQAGQTAGTVLRDNDPQPSPSSDPSFTNPR